MIGISHKKINKLSDEDKIKLLEHFPLDLILCFLLENLDILSEEQNSELLAKFLPKHKYTTHDAVTLRKAEMVWSVTGTFYDFYDGILEPMYALKNKEGVVAYAPESICSLHLNSYAKVDDLIDYSFEGQRKKDN